MEHSQILTDVKAVELSEKGIFKYILIEAKQNGSQNNLKMFVRGSDKFDYHADNYDAFQEALRKQGYKVTRSKTSEGLFTAKTDTKTYTFKCLGGGRIQHNHKGHKCFIYGYSKSFGRVDHKIAQSLISKELSYSMEQITTSQQGY